MVDTDEFLAHFGILGMKWGKRKTPDEPTAETNSQSDKKYFGLTKKQAIIGASVLVGVAVTAVVLTNSGKIKTSLLETGFRESTLNRGQSTLVDFMRDHGDSTDVMFPQGQVFQRISRRAETSISNSAYVNYKPKDVANYAAFWGPQKNRHAIKIEALSDIVTPSLKTRVNTMVEMVDEPLADVIYKGKTLRQALIKEQPTIRAKLWVKNVDATKLAEHQYNNLTGGAWDKGFGKEYTNKLVSKGYDAMMDDRDSRNGIGDSPMVLLNNAMFKITSNKLLTKVEMDDAYTTFNKLLQAEP